MSITMKNVKAISHNNKTVKKIEDTNGNILWGSYDAFPYRKLEYIKFSGAEYILTDYIPSASTAVGIKAKLQSKGDSTWNRLFGAYDGNLANAARRYYFHGNTDDTYPAYCFGSTWQNTTLSNYLNRTLWYTVGNNTAMKTFWIAIKDETNTTAYFYKQLDLGTALTGYNVPLSISSNWSNGNVIDTTAYMKGDVYSFQTKTGTWSAGTVAHDYVPCQRKLDDVCGMYDTITSTFHPMVGTNITSTAAGPVVDEYWDLS